jgi:molybdate-binding protein/DNA-binding XRE family transcriptional regulator
MPPQVKTTMTSPEIANNLPALRRKRGLSAAWLAEEVGVSRQTIYSIEAGSYIPNTAVGLRLARALEVTVEELFTLPADISPEPGRSEPVEILPGSDTVRAGQPVQLCRVDKRLMASAPSPVPWYLPASDAVIGTALPGRKAKAQIYDPDAGFRNRLLVAGCDPAISVLARHVRSAGIELILAHRNSSQALALLKEGAVHIAGTHLRDEATGESNTPQIGRLFPKNAVALFSYGVWEEGIVTASGNPKAIRGVEDFSRKDVRIVNREPGAGSRLLLDTQLKRLKIDARKIAGYEDLAPGHLAAASKVRNGDADCCLATRAAARLFGLGFTPVVSERYDLAIRRQHLELPAIQTLLDTLNRSGFRRDLAGIGGYDAKMSGQRML